MPQVSANKLTIEYQETGPKNGPAVLMIMGLAAQMTFWPDDLIRNLADAGFRVITFDNRDIGLTTKRHGKNAPHPGAQVAARRIGMKRLAPYTLHDMVLDTTGHMDTRKNSTPHLIVRGPAALDSDGLNPTEAHNGLSRCVRWTG